MSETIISPNNVYKLALPYGYKIEESEGTVVIYSDENGNGAINITNYQIPDSYIFDAESELKDFASSVGSVNSQTLQGIVTNNGYAYSEFTIEKRFWKIWVFFKKPYAVFASYNCDQKDKGNEMQKIDKIMQSLRIIY